MDEELSVFCPECGNAMLSVQCDVCKFNFGSFLRCPYIKSGVCTKTGQVCTIQDLDWEICDLVRL